MIDPSDFCPGCNMLYYRCICEDDEQEVENEERDDYGDEGDVTLRYGYGEIP